MDRDEFKDRKYLPRGEWQYTRKEKIQNWFAYNKWWLVFGVVAVIAIVYFIRAAFGIGVVQPDYTIGVITSTGIDDESLKELETALEPLASDLNGDGTVEVSVSQFITGEGIDLEAQLSYGTAALVRLEADIIAGETHFFIMEDPAWFQIRFQALADQDGALPESDDFSVDGRALRWGDCPVLSGLPLSEETAASLENMYIGRRGYYDTEDLEYYADYEELWQILTEGATGWDDGIE